MQHSIRIKQISLCLLLFIPAMLCAQIRLSTPNVESLLYLGKGKKQALVVGLGGSEGGNAWSSDYWKSTREQFLQQGYAFLAIGYFGAPGTPPLLEKIALEDIHFAIQSACEHRKINSKKIAIVGGSRGADLALLLASYYPDIQCVVAIVPSHASFPGHTNHFSTSCWTYNQQELPFVPVNDAAVPFLIQRNLRAAFEAMLSDSLATQKALIPVEKIQGNILFLSATQDEICPSTPMCEQMMARLKEHHFKYQSEHLPIEGGHAAPLSHFEAVFAFLKKYFKNYKK
jgi:pimeloyl-ACP methyl ester carboxylesterase